MDTQFSSGGWTCAVCGAFVPGGAYHDHAPMAPGITNPQPGFTINSLPYMPVLERIAAALEKIARKG